MIDLYYFTALLVSFSNFTYSQLFRNLQPTKKFLIFITVQTIVQL